MVFILVYFTLYFVLFNTLSEIFNIFILFSFILHCNMFVLFNTFNLFIIKKKTLEINMYKLKMYKLKTNDFN